MKLAICIPCRGSVSATAFQYLAWHIGEVRAWWEARNGPDSVHMFAVSRAHVAVARCICLSRACEWGADWLVWMDDDAIPGDGVFQKLFAHQKDIVVPWFVTHHGESVAWNLSKKGSELDKEGPLAKPATLTKIGMSGFHYVLMKQVAARMVYSASQGIPFNFIMRTTGRPIGEDCWFYQQAFAAGVELWLDPTVSVGHIGEVVL